MLDTPHSPAAPRVAALLAGFLPDGRIGSEPSLATPAHGKALFEAAVTDLAAAVRAFRTEP